MAARSSALDTLVVVGAPDDCPCAASTALIVAGEM
jgi:hypothetical protein